MTIDLMIEPQPSSSLCWHTSVMHATKLSHCIISTYGPLSYHAHLWELRQQLLLDGGRSRLGRLSLVSMQVRMQGRQPGHLALPAHQQSVRAMHYRVWCGVVWCCAIKAHVSLTGPRLLAWHEARSRCRFLSCPLLGAGRGLWGRLVQVPLQDSRNPSQNWHTKWCVPSCWLAGSKLHDEVAA